MLEIGTQLQGRYEIEERIGQGGMGAVYRAVDHKFSTSNRVAIKETFYETPELAEAFEREARLLNSLHHPILPHVSDYFTEGGGNFLVMEYIEGEDLSEILKRDGAFPVSDVMRWTHEILDGLDYLHSQQPPVIHRDIKPNNLKLTSRGFIVLLDFGLAKENEDVTLGERSIFGYSRRYSPLEQIEGVGSDARSDIFSLGATVYNLLTGRPPVDALARASAIVAHQPDPLVLASEINSEIPESIAAVLNSALALNADQRFASAKAMSAALEYAVDPAAAAAARKHAGPDAVEAVVAPVGPVDVVAFPALQAFKADIGHNAPEMVDDESIPNISPDPFEAAHEEPVHELGAVDEAAVNEITADDELALVSDAAAPAAGFDDNELINTHAVHPGRIEYAEPRPSWDKGAVWLALILVSLLAVGYGISQFGSVEIEPTQKTEAAAAVNAEQPQAEIVPDPAVVPPAGDVAAVEQKASASKSSAKPATIEPRVDEVVDRPGSRTRSQDQPVADTPEPVRQTTRNAGPVRRQPVRQARRGALDNDQSAPVSSIENVFTGMTPDEVRREVRRGSWQVRTYGNDEELRRERRRLRRQQRQQQNGWPF